MTDDYAFLKDIFLSFAPIVISIIAIGVSLITWKGTRPIENKQYSTESMFRVFDLLSDRKLLDAKRRFAIAYWDSKDNGRKAIFNSGTIKDDANQLKSAFDKVCVLYELGLLDKKRFLQVYDGNIAERGSYLKKISKKIRELILKHAHILKKWQKKLSIIGMIITINQTRYLILIVLMWCNLPFHY